MVKCKKQEKTHVNIFNLISPYMFGIRERIIKIRIIKIVFVNYLLRNDTEWWLVDWQWPLEASEKRKIERKPFS